MLGIAGYSLLFFHSFIKTTGQRFPHISEGKEGAITPADGGGELIV